MLLEILDGATHLVRQSLRHEWKAKKHDGGKLRPSEDAPSIKNTTRHPTTHTARDLAIQQLNSVLTAILSTPLTNERVLNKNFRGTVYIFLFSRLLTRTIKNGL